jgi:O-antigen ligase
MTIFLFASLGIYILGCTISQSLISTGSTLLGIFFIASVFTGNVRKNFFLVSTMFWILYLVGNLYIKNTETHFSWDPYSKIPLWALPVFLFSLKKVQLSRTWLNLLFYLLCCGLTISAGYSIYQVFVLKLPGTGFFKNPIYYAYSVLPLWILCTEYMLSRTQKSLFLFSGFFGGLIAIALAETRVVWLSAVLYLILRGGYVLLVVLKRKLVFWSGVFILIVGGLVLYQGVPRVQKKIDRSFSGTDPSREARIILWKYNTEVFLNNIITGVGTERNAIQSDGNEVFQKYWDPGHKIYAHNLILQLAAEGGLISLVFLGIWVLGLLKNGFSSTHFVLWIGLFSGLTENISNNSRAFNPWLCALVLGLLWLRVHQREVYKTPEVGVPI